MFAFENKVKEGFRAVKREIFQFKAGVHDWIQFLSASQQDHDARIAALEQRINHLEAQLHDSDTSRSSQVERDVFELRTL
ncbi:hypothetical protein HY772_01780 [Candidatus Woesearchaeota archaeon]|nr:hypothetical protein [Candidatus Woesearchaeota archaeon]